MKVKENYQVTKRIAEQSQCTQRYIGGTQEPITDEVIARYTNMIRQIINKKTVNAVFDYDDLFNEGIVHIIRGLESFDPFKGTQLNTWVYRCIHDGIAEYYFNNMSHLSGGKYLYNGVRKWQEINKTIDLPTIEQLQEFGFSRKTALALGYFWKKPATYGPQLNLIDRETKRQFNTIEGLLPDLTECLNEKELFAINHYFGFNGKCMTMREIGEQLNKSRKAVSYLINKAIVKIRHEPGIENYFFNSDKTEYVFSTYVSNESDED